MGGGVVILFPTAIVIFVILICTCCIVRKLYNRGEVISRAAFPSAPVVVTTTTIPAPVQAGYPAQSAVGYPMPQPQPQPGFAPQPYPHNVPYPMPQPQVEHNPPSYDQVMRGGEAYQKQAPYNPNYTGQ